MLSDLLSQANALSGSRADVAALQNLVDDLLGRLLLLEGPPVEPIPGVSEDLRRALARNPKGRPLTVARTWTTGPWRCLLLESPSIPMGRAIFIPRDRSRLAKPVFTAGDFRAILPSRTRGAISRIVSACQALGIAEPIGEGAVRAVFGGDRTFLAWRPREEDDEPFNRALRGDVDNYCKTVLDALQSAGVLPNDRGVARLVAVKDLPASWTPPPPSLEDAIRQEVEGRRGKGEALETIRVELRLSRAHMARLFPGEYKASGQKKDPARAAAEAHRALELIWGCLLRRRAISSGGMVARSKACITSSLVSPLRVGRLEGRGVFARPL